MIALEDLEAGDILIEEGEGIRKITEEELDAAMTGELDLTK